MPATPATPSDPRTTLALQRTRLAHERALMAWVRTAASLISFGFTIYKFFQYLRESQPGAAHGRFGPRGFALVMIGLGVSSLTLATIQHRQDLEALELEYGELPRSTAGAVAAVVSMLGIVALALVFFHQ